MVKLPLLPSRSRAVSCLLKEAEQRADTRPLRPKDKMSLPVRPGNGNGNVSVPNGS